MIPPVPALRIRSINDAPVRPAGSYVLYWCIAHRRMSWNFALDRAVEWCRELGKPLVILEALRCDYPWASQRLHRFVLDGMRANAQVCARAGVRYLPYVEPRPGAGRGLLAALAEHAAVVVTDDFPCFFLPAMVAAAGRALSVRLEAVDANGLLPVRAPGRDYPTAFAFRRYLHKHLAAHLEHTPARQPFARLRSFATARLPRTISVRWSPASQSLLAGEAGALAALPVSSAVTPVASAEGGTPAARAALRRFLDDGLSRYLEARNQPEAAVTSGLSPYLHFGHLSIHEVLASLAEREAWSPDLISAHPTGARAGWWGLSPPAESFLDEAVTWRELGYVFNAHRDDYDRYASLPDWARATLDQHANDPRAPCYTRAQLDAAETHDPLWNAAQWELRRTGRIHNYLRMLWGKKILQWTPSPHVALEILIDLNNRYALDGRNPNSYSGIFWVLGRYDRPWGPERPIFGKIRYMTSENTARKVRVAGYIARHTPGTRQAALF